MHFPFPVKIHVVAIGNAHEVDLEQYERFARSRFGSFHYIELPQGVRSFKQVFDKLAGAHCILCTLSLSQGKRI